MQIEDTLKNNDMDITLASSRVLKGVYLVLQMSSSKYTVDRSKQLEKPLLFYGFLSIWTEHIFSQFDFQLQVLFTTSRRH